MLMTYRKVNFIEENYYHVYNRGNSKAAIFHDEQDYKRFQKILYLYNGSKKFKFKDLFRTGKNIYSYETGERLVDIISYVLMPNHFHIFVYYCPQKTKVIDKNLGNNISVFLKRVSSAYSQYYNHKYKRTGSLFESRFKAEHVDSGEYFKYLFSYIHLNPVKLIQKDWKENGIKDLKQANDFLKRYCYSSFSLYFPVEYRNNGEEKIVNTAIFWQALPADINLSIQILEWLNYRKNSIS